VKKTGVNTAALSGGVFQNMLLMDKCRKLLEADGFTVLIHSLVPPNDGGIALGQAVAAAEKLENNNIL
jgi:hydrogenase maturation protein HypF